MKKEELEIGKYYYIAVAGNRRPAIYRLKLEYINGHDEYEKEYIYGFNAEHSGYGDDELSIHESDIERIQTTPQKAHAQLVKMFKKIAYDSYLEVK